MKLIIENESTVKDVQKQFNTFFPFLQLQFLKSIDTDNVNVQKMTRANPELQVRKLNPLHLPVDVPIENIVTVAELLNNFREIGLRAQVCRKSANQWVETSLTDDWTLERQNREAMLLSIIPESTR